MFPEERDWLETSRAELERGFFGFNRFGRGSPVSRANRGDFCCDLLRSGYGSFLEGDIGTNHPPIMNEQDGEGGDEGHQKRGRIGRQERQDEHPERIEEVECRNGKETERKVVLE